MTGDAREIYKEGISGAKYTPTLVQKFLDKLKRGYTIEVACRSVGINRRTYYSWRGAHVGFLEAVERAKGACEEALVDRMMIHADNDWRAAKFLLERRFRHWAGVPMTTVENRDELDSLRIEKARLELDYIRTKMEALQRIEEPEETVTVLEVLNGIAQIEEKMGGKDYAVQDS